MAAADAASSVCLLVARALPGAQLPARATPGAAGYDLCSAGPDTVILHPGTRSLVDTGLIIAVPYGTYGRVAPRSGLAVRGVDVGAGVIDADYRGHVKVLLINNGATPLEVAPGQRIAQLILERVDTPRVLEMTPEALGKTQRGAAGFGSTGV